MRQYARRVGLETINGQVDLLRKAYRDRESDSGRDAHVIIQILGGICDLLGAIEEDLDDLRVLKT